MKNYQKMLLGLVMVAGVATGCKKNKEELNEEELITTVQLKFTETGTSNTTTATFRDIDGDGGNAPTSFDNIVLAPGKTYDVSIELKDESKTPALDITDEVEEEGDEHQFYFVPSAVNITVSNLNTDALGLPLGTTSKWTTGAASTGVVKVVLKHKPGGIKAAGDLITKGETDIELDFNARIQ